MRHGYTCLLLVCFVACVSALTYEPIVLDANGSGAANGDLDPCQRAFYSVAISDPNPLGYLEVTVSSDIDTLVVIVSDEPFDAAALLNDSRPNHLFSETGSDVISVAAICPFENTPTWYITVDNVDTGAAVSTSFSITISEEKVPVTELTLGTVHTKNATSPDQSMFKSAFDFYHFTTTATSAVMGETLNITLSDTTADIAGIYFNKGTVPAYGYDLNTCVLAASSDSTSLIVDYCTWNNALVNTDAGTDYYIAISPENTAVLGYDILVDTESPKITPLSVNTLSNKIYSLIPDQINYYSIAVSDVEKFINTTITNVQGGSVDFAIEFNVLPFIACVGGSNCNEQLSNCCDSVSTQCELVIQPCRVESGLYYVGVKALSVANPNIPLTYQLNAGNHGVPGSVSISDSDFVTSSISQSHYDFYEYSPSGTTEIDATLNIHLYVDRTVNAGVETTLFINSDETAGENCWESLASCTVTAEGYCSIQINPCQYAEFDNWFITVFGGNVTTQGYPTDYTVFASLDTPTELTESHLVISSSVPNGQIQHYELDSDLLPSGSVLAFVIFDTTGGNLNVYMNQGDLAGPTNTCPICYNSTKTGTTDGDAFEWTISNCGGDDDMDDIYFAVEGIADDDEGYVGYSLTVIASDNESVPSDDLKQNQVLVDSVEGNAGKNYTLNGDASGTQAYMLLTLSQINYQGDNTLEVNLYNTTNLNCLVDESTLSLQCNIDNDGFCSLVVQACQFNSSDGWIVEVVNSDSNEIFYNLFYDIYAADPTGLENAVSMAGTVQTGVYDQFVYSASGSDTLIVEVFFDNCVQIDGSSCDGTLYLSQEGEAGASGCFYDSISQTDSEKCVFAMTSCDLPEEDFYFSVTTNSTLYPESPLGYTIKVTEKDPVVPVQVNVPTSHSAYPNEKVYHTFSYTNNPAKGSTISVEVSNVVGGTVQTFLAQTPPPTTSGSCPCFEFSTGLNVDYCDAVTGEWTVLVQPSGNDNQLVSYVITVLEFVSSPVALTLNTPADGSVLQGRYNYYSIGGTAGGNADQYTLSIQNIIGGSVEIYYSAENPATTACSLGSVCGLTSTSCFTQIGACIGSPNYISVYGSAVTTYDPVTYSISIIESTPVLLSNTPTNIQYVDPDFIQLFSFDIGNPVTLTDSIEVTFNVNDAQTNSTGGLAYELLVFESSPCNSALDTSSCDSDSCRVRVSECTMDNQFYLGVRNLGNEQMNFTATANSTNIANQPENLAIGVPDPITILDGEYQMFVVAVSNASQSKNLVYNVTATSGTFQSYFGVGKATPDCNDHDESDPVTFDSYTVSACCVRDALYEIAIQAVDGDVDVIVTFDYEELIATPIPVTTSPLDTTTTLSGGETQEFVITLDPMTDYASFWVKVNTTAPNPSSFYLQHGSIAGPVTSVGECITNMAAQTGSPFIFNSPQCVLDDSFTEATPYQGGSIYIGVENAGTTTESFDYTIEYGMMDYVPLTLGNETSYSLSQGLNYYFTVDTEVTLFEDLNVVVTSDSSITTKVYFDSSCSTSIVSCTLETQCNVTASTICVYNGVYVIEVISPSEDADIVVTAAVVNKDALMVDLDSQSDVAIDGTTDPIVMATATVPNGSGDLFAQLILTNFTGVTSNLAISYTVNGDDACIFQLAPYTCDNDGTSTTCVATFGSCMLAPGEFVFEIQSGAQYTLNFAATTQTSTVIDFPSVTVGSVFENERVSYNLTVDYTTLSPGQTIDITLDVTCGDATLYLNQAYVAGPACFFSDENTVSISSCALAGAPLIDYLNDVISVTVVGGVPSYPSLDLPSQYILEVDVSGPPAVYRPIGPDQLTYFGGQNIIYVLPVNTGIADFFGELEIVLTGTGNAANLDISMSQPSFCDVSNTLSVGSDMMDKIVYDACDLENVDQVYFQFTAGSDADASFEIVHVNSFIRNMNDYADIPQSGAVTPSIDSASEVVDEEYFSIMVDPSASNFQFTAWIENTSDDVRLSTGIGMIPSMCNQDDNDFTTVTPGNKITYDWCDFTTTDTIYLTVNAPSTSLGTSAEGYDLYYSIAVDVEETALTPNTPICDTVSANEPNYYTANVAATPTQLNSIEVYSVNANQPGNTLTAYLAIDGLATPGCTDAGNIQTCTSSQPCHWEFPCPITANVSVVIENTSPISTTSTDYFIVWNEKAVNTVAITQNTPYVSESAPANVVDYFTFALPNIDVTSQYMVISLLGSDDDDNISLMYSTSSIPSADCQDTSCQSTSGFCYITLNSCAYQGGSTSYIAVMADSAFTLTASLIDIPVTDLAPNTFAETTLTTSSVIPVTYAGYKVTVTQDMIANSLYGDMVVSVYGVNQGSLTVYVSSFGSEDCIIDQKIIGTTSTSGNLVVSACRFTAGDYYITAQLDADNQNDACTPVSFGVMATFKTVDAESVALTSGTPVTIPYSVEPQYFTFTNSDVLSVTVTSNSDDIQTIAAFWTPAYASAPSASIDECTTEIVAPVSYYWGCEKTSASNMIVQSLGVSGVVLADAEVTLTVRSEAVSTLTSTPAPFSFTDSFETTHFHSFTLDEDQSVQIVVDVAQGPAVNIQFWDQNCSADNENEALLSVNCFGGVCMIPFSYSVGSISNSTTPYYVTVSGYGPASYSIYVEIGEEETCSEVPNTDLCDISWTVWTYNSGSQQEDAQNAAAIRFYNQLADAFCQPCSCQEISQKCNNSLIEYTCTQTYRACGDNGLQTSVCEDSCSDIEENCGMTFEQAGLPTLSCNHNFYYSGDNDICTDIYDVEETDATDILLYLVVIVVVFVVILIIVAVIAFLVFKKYKAKRVGDSYEMIADAETDEE